MKKFSALAVASCAAARTRASGDEIACLPTSTCDSQTLFKFLSTLEIPVQVQDTAGSGRAPDKNLRGVPQRIQVQWHLNTKWRKIMFIVNVRKA